VVYLKVELIPNEAWNEQREDKTFASTQIAYNRGKNRLVSNQTHLELHKTVQKNHACNLCRLKLWKFSVKLQRKTAWNGRRLKNELTICEAQITLTVSSIRLRIVGPWKNIGFCDIKEIHRTKFNLQAWLVIQNNC
jgi:hypothetical protein